MNRTIKRLFLTAVAVLTLSAALASCAGPDILSDPPEASETEAASGQPSAAKALKNETGDQYIIDLDGYKQGDTLTFGEYEQDGDTSNGKEPIEWILLDNREGGSCLMVSKYALDCIPFDDAANGSGSSNESDPMFGETDAWSHTTSSEWLNDDFYQEAFGDDEKEFIVTYSARCTKDNTMSFYNVFMLTDEEAKYYFPTDAERKAGATEYAVSRGSYEEDGACGWWLRTESGSLNDSLPRVSVGGSIIDKPDAADRTDYSVRPAILVRSTKLDMPDISAQEEKNKILGMSSEMFAKVYFYTARSFDRVLNPWMGDMLYCGSDYAVTDARYHSMNDLLDACGDHFSQRYIDECMEEEPFKEQNGKYYIGDMYQSGEGAGELRTVRFSASAGTDDDIIIKGNSTYTFQDASVDYELRMICENGRWVFDGFRDP